MSWRWNSFSPSEVLGRDGLLLYERRGHLFINQHAMDELQAFRTHIGKPFFINGEVTGSRNRGYRSFLENKEAGGKKYSYHMQGLAFDVTAEDMDSVELFEAALKRGWGAVGLYNTFVHMDLRYRPDGRVVTWDNRA